MNPKITTLHWRNCANLCVKPGNCAPGQFSGNEKLRCSFLLSHPRLSDMVVKYSPLDLDETCAPRSPPASRPLPGLRHWGHGPTRGDSHSLSSALGGFWCWLWKGFPCPWLLVLPAASQYVQWTSRKATQLDGKSMLTFQNYLILGNSWALEEWGRVNRHSCQIQRKWDI